MSVTIYDGWPHALYGMPEEGKPILGIPPEAERVKLRFRPDDWAKAFVKTATGIRLFVIAENQDGTWTLAYEQGRNERLA